PGTKPIRGSTDVLERAAAQPAHREEKANRSKERPPSGLLGSARASSSVLGLKARAPQDAATVSVSDAPPLAPAPIGQPQDQFRLQVDRQTKASYPTFEAAKAAGLALKQNHPVLHIAVCDGKSGLSTLIDLPKT